MILVRSLSRRLTPQMEAPGGKRCWLHCRHSFSLLGEYLRGQYPGRTYHLQTVCGCCGRLWPSPFSKPQSWNVIVALYLNLLSSRHSACTLGMSFLSLSTSYGRCWYPYFIEEVTRITELTPLGQGRTADECLNLGSVSGLPEFETLTHCTVCLLCKEQKSLNWLIMFEKQITVTWQFCKKNICGSLHIPWEPQNTIEYVDLIWVLSVQDT